MSELEQLALQQAQREALASDMAEFCENINSVLQSPTPQEKQQVLRLVVDHILVGKEQLIIKHVVPLTGDRRLHTQRSSEIVILGLLSSHETSLRGTRPNYSPIVKVAQP